MYTGMHLSIYSAAKLQVCFNKLTLLYLSVRVVNEKERERRAPTTRRRRGSAVWGVREGSVPSPQKICSFIIWHCCILGACFNVSIRRVKVKAELTLPLYKKERERRTGTAFLYVSVGLEH